MRRALVVCAGVLLVAPSAFGGIHAVAKPETQTAPINGTAADFDGSDSYTDEPPPVTYWAWDFDGDAEDDHHERSGYSPPDNDGVTTHVYDQAGIFTCRLTVKDAPEEREDTDTQEVKVRLEVSTGDFNGTDVEVLWDNANNVSQFTRYEVHKSTSQGFEPGAGTKVTDITNMATTSYTVTGLTPKTTYYFQVVLVVTGGSLQSNEASQATGGDLGVKYLYDKVGSLTRVLYTDDGGANWETSDYGYDDVYALTKVTFPDSKTISYYYDKAALRTRMIDPASNVVTYLYDDRGYLTKVSVGGSTHGTYYYDDAGRRTRLLYGNSSYASYLYDDANHLTLISNRKSDNNVISSFAYTVDDTGNRTKLTLSNGDYADYVYDDTYQLTREHRRDSGDSTLYYNNFYYDAAGNRTRLEYNDGGGTTTTTYLYNPADQLTRETVGGTNTDYLYDANGSLTKKDDGTNVHSYAYDVRNLMTDYDGPGTSNDATYAYDAADRRVQRVVGGSTTTNYYHDGLNVVAEYNGSNQLQRTYVTPGLDANLTMTASGSTYYYLTDALGSVRQLIDANEATQNSYDYFAFGKVYGTPTENVTQPVRFTGREWDGEDEQYHYRARKYDASRGSFSTRDPQDPLGRAHLYVYVENNPLLHLDPLGLWKVYRVTGLRSFNSMPIPHTFVGWRSRPGPASRWESNKVDFGRGLWPNDWGEFIFGTQVGTVKDERVNLLGDLPTEQAAPFGADKAFFDETLQASYALDPHYWSLILPPHFDCTEWADKVLDVGYVRAGSTVIGAEIQAAMDRLTQEIAAAQAAGRDWEPNRPSNPGPGYVARRVGMRSDFLSETAEVAATARRWDMNLLYPKQVDPFGDPVVPLPYHGNPDLHPERMGAEQWFTSFPRRWWDPPTQAE